MYNILVKTVKPINQTNTPDIALDIKFFNHPITKQFPSWWFRISILIYSSAHIFDPRRCVDITQISLLDISYVFNHALGVETCAW